MEDAVQWEIQKFEIETFGRRASTGRTRVASQVGTGTVKRREGGVDRVCGNSVGTGRSRDVRGDG